MWRYSIKESLLLPQVCLLMVIVMEVHTIQLFSVQVHMLHMYLETIGKELYKSCTVSTMSRIR